MQNPNELRLQKMMNLLSQLPLTQEELDHGEYYLEGGEQSHLDCLAFRDLSEVPEETQKGFRSLFKEFSDRGRNQEYARLFQLVFQLGQSTSYMLYPSDLLRYKSGGLEQLDAACICSLYAEQACENQHYLTRYWIERLIELAGNNAGVLKKAFDYHKGKFDNGLMVLYAAYFHVRYKERKRKWDIAYNKNEGKQDGQQGGLLKGITKLFKGESEDEVLHLSDAGDQKMLDNCVNSIASSIGNLFSKKLPAYASEAMEKYVRQPKDEPLPKQLYNLSRGYAVNQYLLRLLGGCAFSSFELSPKLRNFLRLCAAADRGGLLIVMEWFNMDDKLTARGGNFDLLFDIDQKEFLLWTAQKQYKNILYTQFDRDSAFFIQCMDQADGNGFQAMMEVVKAKDKSLYKGLKDDKVSGQREKVIKAVIPAGISGFSQLCDYLRGELPADDIYPYAGELAAGSRYAWQERNLLNQYRDMYGKDDFYTRCLVILIMKRASYAMMEELTTVQSGRRNQPNEQAAAELYARLSEAGLSLNYQLQCGEMIYEYIYSESQKKMVEKATVKAFSRYLAETPDKTLQAFRDAGATGRSMGVKTLGRLPERHKEDLLAYGGDSSKAVKEALVEVLRKQKDWAADITGLLKSKKAAQREMAIQVMRGWKEPEYRQLLQEALDTEKSSKLAALLRDVLNLTSDEVQQVSATPEEKVKELHKGGKKRTLAWAYETPFCAVHMKGQGDGEDVSGEANRIEASEEYLQAVLLCYASMSTPGVSKDAAWLAEKLDERELAVYVNELFDKWLEAGAEAKKKWVLYAASIHGGSEIVERLKHQINEWPQHARGAMAAEAVKALALNSEPAALLTVDSIARKFKFKQVKAAAAAALDFAAAQLGMTREELADKIVPDLGFNERMERIFDYGTRKFKVYLTQNLELEIFDENDKKLKNLPAPGKKDDPEQAVKENQAFKDMKKQMKTTVANQKLRLEQALSVERKWSKEGWNNLFVKNPVMHQFAISLIWGVYEKGKLVQTFRYMEDGTFNTEDEEEYTMPETCQIGLVHPIELSEESRKTWEEQLEDYEVAQSVEQLKRTVYPLEPGEEKLRQLERFGGCILNGLSLSGKLQSQGWYRGSVQDAGGYYTFYREDQELGLGVELHFSGLFVGDENEEITVYDARFYEAGKIKRGSYMYDEVKPEKAIPLKDVPARYFSEIVLQLARATASSQERNENWREKR